jgi:hypothetical protein
MNMSDTSHYTRREFFDRTAKGAIGLIGYSLLKPFATKASSMTNGKSWVVAVNHDSASVIDHTVRDNPYFVNQEIAQAMVDEGIRRLTGLDSIGEAWKSLFPSITQNKVISIKVNCLGRGGFRLVPSNNNSLAAHPEVAYSVAKSLSHMQFDGYPFPKENIIIWDRSDIELSNAGYTINKGGSGIRCYGTTQNLANNTDDKYMPEAYDVNGTVIHFSKIVEKSDFIINLSVLKAHGNAGVTLSLKNLYGIIDINPGMGSLHSTNSDPAIAQLNNIDIIRNKQVVCICDAIYGLVSGSPTGPPQATPNKLIFSKDPVAIDTIGMKLLREHGMSSSLERMAKHIATAAREPYNRGTNDINRINLAEVDITKSYAVKKGGKQSK